MSLLKELRHIASSSSEAPKLHCKVHEDNQGCIDLVESPKIRPRTKHIAIKYHHFRKHVQDGTVTIEYVETKLQIADILTKALGDAQFTTLRKMISGW